jgi:hypothetical protein
VIRSAKSSPAWLRASPGCRSFASTFPTAVEKAELDKRILDQFVQIRPSRLELLLVARKLFLA